MNKLYFLLIFFVTICIPLNAQISKGLESKSKEDVVRCYTTEMTERLAQKNSKYRKSFQSFENWLRPKIHENEKLKTYSGNIIIPVVIHIVHSGVPVNTTDSIYGENISYKQALSQIKVLNEDFRRMMGTPGFDTIGYNRGVDTGIEFRLATIAPDGSATNGVNRINKCNDDWSIADIEDVLKPETIWDPTKYLNIWSIKLSNPELLGYAQFPSQSGLVGINEPDVAETDGVVSNYVAIGTVNEDDGSFILHNTYNQGRTLTHEIGHWLGLRHIWGDGGCDVDDYCEDTPNAAKANYGCPKNRSSCESIDMVENYMDYTDDYCMNTFTQDQSDRMHTVLTNSPRRKELLSANVFGNTSVQFDGKLAFNCVETEITKPCEALTEDISISFELINTAPIPLESANISIHISGGNTENIDWSGKLNQFESETIQLSIDPSKLNTGMNQIQVEILTLNGTTDELEANNALTIDYAYEPTVIQELTESIFTLTIVPDQWASELSWEVQDSNGNVVVSGGGNYENGALEPIIVPFELDAIGCYSLHFKDSYGDGIDAPGYYELQTASGEVVVKGADFGSEEVTTFKVGALAVNDYNVEEFNIYPNPSAGEVFINHRFKEDNFLVNVYNENGQLVYSRKHSDNIIKLHHLKPGVYLLQIKVDGKNISHKLILK